MRLYTLPDNTVINLDAVIAVGPLLDSYHYQVHLLGGTTITVDSIALPRSRFLDVLASHS